MGNKDFPGKYGLRMLDWWFQGNQNSMVVFSLHVSGVAKHDGSVNTEWGGIWKTDVNMQGEEQGVYPWIALLLSINAIPRKPV